MEIKEAQGRGVDRIQWNVGVSKIKCNHFSLSTRIRVCIGAILMTVSRSGEPSLSSAVLFASVASDPTMHDSRAPGSSLRLTCARIGILVRGKQNCPHGHDNSSSLAYGKIGYRLLVMGS